MNLFLLLVRPTAFGDAFSGEVNHRVEAVQFCRIDFILVRMPFDFIGLRRISDHARNLVAVRFQ